MEKLGEYLSRIIGDLGKLRKASDQEVREEIDPILIYLAERVQAIAEKIEEGK